MPPDMTAADTKIFDIGHFSVHDGPGIRTTVFLKGCPLRCLWCHNPESQSEKSEIFFTPSRCVGCGACFTVCPASCHRMENKMHLFDRKRCTQCGICAANCPAGALELCGRHLSPEEVMAEVLKDRVFYETSGGGMTVSGGEPLAHFDYLFRLLSLARKEKIHTCVETSGYAPFEHIRALIPLVSLWLWDFKASEADHRRLTGVEAERIRGNLRKLDACGAPLVLRCPWIPEINDSSAYSEELLEISAELKSVRRIEIEPYQPLGEDKYKRLGRPLLCEAKFPSKKASGDYLKFLQNRTNIPVVEG